MDFEDQKHGCNAYDKNIPIQELFSEFLFERAVRLMVDI